MKPTTLAALLFLASGCRAYDAPPQPTIVGLVDGLLADATTDLTVAWHESIDATTLNLRIVRFDTDPEGELLPEAQVFFHHTAGTNIDGAGTFDEGETSLTIDPTIDLPVATQLALVIEPGLSDLRGNTWDVRQILKFSYSFLCNQSDPRPTAFPPQSAHFLLVEVESPISAQLQLFADLRVDPETGSFSGQFSNADRDASISCAPFGLSCTADEVCRTLPAPACVPPSERVSVIDEYPDFAVNATPPTGYSFTIDGCVRDTDSGSFVLGNLPADVHVESPDVTVRGIEFNLSIAPPEGDVYRGQGSFKAQLILLGNTPVDPGVGTVLIRDLPPADVPPDLPPPPHLPGE